MSRIFLLTSAVVSGLVVAGSASAFGGPMGPGERPSFAQLDTDGDGKVTVAELNAFPAARAAERFKTGDANADGQLSKEELAASFEMMRAAEDLARAADMIARIDSDKNGSLSQAEMDAMMAQGPMKGAPGAQMMEMADTDKDGAISEQEFTAMAAMAGPDMGKHDKRGGGDCGGREGRGGHHGDAPFWRN